MSTATTTIYAVSGVLLLVAAALTTLRLLRGPSSLDRVVAVDVLVALVVAGMATYAAATGDSTLVPAIVALTLLAFVGSVSVARYRVRDER